MVINTAASHNPKEYNDYKAYWEEGSQILDDIADRIVTHIENIQNFGEIAVMNFEEGIQKGIIEYVPEEVLTSYMSKVENLSLHENIDYDTCIVYSPLNGTGNKPVREILRRKGFTNINVVKEQENPDRRRWNRMPYSCSGRPSRGRSGKRSRRDVFG